MSPHPLKFILDKPELHFLVRKGSPVHDLSVNIENCVIGKELSVTLGFLADNTG
jgi:hypothetical protein